ncbi:MAG: hypothetical protein NTZ05_15500 [Chloroflexi bacterium]|nr:hypothetical protein [Chloroflexota bacterium]
MTYAYNDSGDRTSLMRWTGSPGSWSQDGSTVSSSYDNAGRLTAAGGVNYCHDANGNQTRRNGSTCSTGGDTFGWDTHNRFLNYNPSAGSATAYGYNGDGVRVKKTVGSAATYYFQDVAGGLPRVAAELPTSTYVWTFYVYGLDLIAQVGDDGAARYYHYDGNGNVRAISDATGAVVERYDYDAFGSLRNTPLGATNDRRYTGEQHDTESGYTFLRARYYDPTLGRFISKDPFDGVKQDPQSLNGYIYVQNNPINAIDPSGLVKIELVYRELPQYNYGTPVHHSYIVVTERDGSQRSYSGMPDGQFCVCIRGFLVGVSEKYQRDSGEWGKGENPQNVSKVITIVDNDDPSGPTHKALNYFQEKVNNASIVYNPFGANSNTFSHHAIEFLGHKRPTPPVWAPGWSHYLPIAPEFIPPSEYREP